MYSKFVVTNNTAAQYLSRLIGKTYKLLPIWEEDKKFGTSNFEANHQRLIDELTEADKAIFHSDDFVAYIFKIGALLDIANLDDVEDSVKQRRIKIHIRECIDLVNKCAEKFKVS